MLEVTRIKKIYSDRTVLDIESLFIKKGETVVVVGPNGSGKSTLLKILAGVIQASEGEYNISGENVYYLPQHSIPFGKTVKKNIIFASKDKRNAEKRSEEILKELGLSHLSDKNARGLSGGEYQRMAIGRILVNKADFLLLDEPSSAADIEGNEIIEKALVNYKNKTGCSILMTTHSPRQAMNLADRIVILYEGKIVEQGRPDEILSAPSTEWGRRFIDSWKING